ncbi:MAG: nucleotidyltransferase domain-containing protein [Nanoarchaeota archaeon]
MNLEIKSIRNKLNKIIKKDDILDVILFGSSIKGKPDPGDIDIAIISENEIASDLFNLNGFHFSFLKPLDFFKRRITLLNTLFREGYSLKFNKPFSELYGFMNKILFIYELKGLSSSKKVKIVNILRGKKNSRGLVVENNGNWLANQVFLTPVNREYIFEKFFVSLEIKFMKHYVLMH